MNKVKSFNEFIGESFWGDVHKRSRGDVIRREDAFIDNETLKSKIKQLYKEQGEGDTLDVSSLSKYRFDDLSKVFDSFSNVKHIIGLENWDVSMVTNMLYTFSFCRSLKELNISNWDVSNVTNMLGTFGQCNDILHLDLSNWDVSNVTDMSFMFYGCTYLKDLNISDWDVSKVTRMNEMFNGCWALPELDISNWDVSNVTRMENMFRGCYHLENLNIDNWDVSNVKDMNKNMFGGTNLIKKPKWYKI